MIYEIFGAKGYRIDYSDELLPILNFGFGDDAISVTTGAVDYSQNRGLIDKLGHIAEALQRIADMYRRSGRARSRRPYCHYWDEE